jgi:hypothetical protein
MAASLITVIPQTSAELKKQKILLLSLFYGFLLESFRASNGG